MLSEKRGFFSALKIETPRFIFKIYHYIFIFDFYLFYISAVSEKRSIFSALKIETPLFMNRVENADISTSTEIRPQMGETNSTLGFPTLSKDDNDAYILKTTLIKWAFCSIFSEYIWKADVQEVWIYFAFSDTNETNECMQTSYVQAVQSQYWYYLQKLGNLPKHWNGKSLSLGQTTRMPVLLQTAFNSYMGGGEDCV